jgi:sulfite reductase (NADPH) flavoprotein alpha-component
MNIYYGSQSGNCEEIAKLLQYRIEKECNLTINCDTLNSLTPLVLLDNKIINISYVFIVTSTYGNGDAPENASKFWRVIKKRTTNKLLFEDINFCILALGNSNYDKFCNFGKNVDKRLHELGGTRTLNLTCVDEVDGLEEPVSVWCDKVIELINNAYLNN